jgi:phosphatidylglycerophosphate synthase
MTIASPTTRSIGTNPTLIWGMTSGERLRRIALSKKLSFEQAGAQSALLVAASHVFDHQWLSFMLSRPGEMLTLGGQPVIAHVTSAAQAGANDFPAGLTEIRVEDHRVFYNEALRKREEPMFEALIPANVRAIERASYFGAYKGVTDILTKYLWPEWALVLTRIAARIGMTPNQVTIIGVALCVAATFLFWHGYYWIGMVLGLIFMVLDTVDGKLARCTITSSEWGHILDHGTDLIHPLFWWWAWAEGLGAWGLALSTETFALVMGALVAGYVIQRVIEGLSIKWFGGMHIHTWEKIDSDFRLITARRNPNMVILLAATAFDRPDIGIIAVAWWTVISCAFHAVRLAQALARRAKGEAITSWLTV